MRAGHEVHLLCQDRDPAGAGVGRRGGGLGRRRARGPHAPRAGARDRLPARHRRPAAALRRRPLRGHRGAAVPRAQRARRSRTTCGATSTAVREVAEARAPGRRARQPPRDGPGRARPRARRPRRARTRSRSTAARSSTRSSPIRASCPTPPRGWRARGGVLVGSRHTAESLWEAMGDPGLPARTRLGPPGVDVERFTPREPAARARAGLDALRARLDASARPPAHPPARPSTRDEAEAAAALATVAPGRPARSCSSAS